MIDTDTPMMDIEGCIRDALDCIRGAIIDFENIFSDDKIQAPSMPQKFKPFLNELKAIETQIGGIIGRHPEIKKWLDDEKEHNDHLADLADANSY